MINSNDIFKQIGLSLSPRKERGPVSKTVFLEIELGEDEKHLLQVQEDEAPDLMARKFCQEHRLNRLAVSIIEQKILEAQNRQRQQPSPEKGEIGRSKSPLQEEYRPKHYKNNRQGSVSPLNKRAKHNEDIYLRGVLKSRMQEEQITRKKAEQDQKQQQELTFKPTINKVSEKIAEFLKDNNERREKTKVKAKTPSKPTNEELKECTFKPKINKTSQRIHENKSILKEERRQFQEVLGKESQAKLGHSCKALKERELFKPKINPKSSEKVSMPFFQRLEVAMEKKNKNRSRVQAPDDEECSFQPKIGRGPRASRNQENRPVWEHLFSESKKGCVQKAEGKELAHQLSCTSLHSQNYYGNLVEETVKSVFNTLDCDCDGAISPDSIGVQNLSPPTLIFLKPIFLEMDSINATLTFKDFRKAVLALMEDSDPGAKGAFVCQKWKREEEEISPNQFKPKINKKSKQMGGKRCPEKLYEDGLKEKQNKEYKLERQRALKEQKELEECSFRPSLNQSSVYINKIAKKKGGPQHSINELINSFANENQHDS